MRYARELLTSTVVGGLLVVAPIYLALLVLLKAVQAMVGLIRPIAGLLPAWAPAAEVVAFLILLLVCAMIGVAVRTRTGRAVREQMEKRLFARLPGYALFRSLTQRLAGKPVDSAWKPALVEIEDALVPAFIVEALDDERFTVFVPSAPTPMSGAVYVLARARVHPIDVPFTQVLRCLSRWGAGTAALVAALNQSPAPLEAASEGRRLEAARTETADNAAALATKLPQSVRTGGRA